MPYSKPLIEAWREQAVSRFGKALVAEMEKHGGPQAYGELIGVKTPTMGTWVRNTSKPGPDAARRMAEVSPAIKPHLEERGCFDAPARDKRYQRKQAPVPLTAAAQTTETARQQHQRALTAAERRALKLRREPLIKRAARKVNARIRAKRKHGDAQHSKLVYQHINPCTHGGQFAIAEGIGIGAADVAVHDSYDIED